MRIVNPKKTVSLSQIVNRKQAMKRVLFRSEQEAKSREIWLKIIKRESEYAHYGIKVVDNTPDESIEGMKKYSILYGLKYLYAAEKLKLETIPVTVIEETEDLDMNVITAFFNSDYSSKTEYEKGVFLEKLRQDRSMTLSDLAKRTGYSYGTLQSLTSAFITSQEYPCLEAAYKNGLLSSYMLRHTKMFFDRISYDHHQLLTDYLIKNGRHAIAQLKEAVNNREVDTTIPQAILDEISSLEITCQDIQEPGELEQLTEALKKDGINLSEKELLQLADRIITDKKLVSQIKECLKIHQKCINFHKELCAALPPIFVLDNKTALTLPDRARSSYALPKNLKKKYTRSWNKNEIRLFCRMLEYIGKSGDRFSNDGLIDQTYKLFLDFRCQNSFAAFFRFSILYRNKRDKILATYDR